MPALVSALTLSRLPLDALFTECFLACVYVPGFSAAVCTSIGFICLIVVMKSSPNEFLSSLALFVGLKVSIFCTFFSFTCY